MMNKLALYVFPLGVVVGGPFLPIAIIIYWVSNNIWTFGQQHYTCSAGSRRKKKPRRKRRWPAEPPTLRRRASSRPSRRRCARRARRDQRCRVEATDEAAGDAEIETDAESAKAADDGSVSRTPRPGARPKKRKR